MLNTKTASLVAAGLLIASAGTSQAASVPLTATGWNVDFILGAGETHAAHEKPENANIWFAENSTVGSLGLPSSGAVTAAGIDFQFGDYSNGTDNALRASGTPTLTLNAPDQYASISFLASNTGGSGGQTWSLTLHFSDAASESVNYTSPDSWAGGTSDVSPNPRLTGNGTTAGFTGAIQARTIDLAGLGLSSNNLTSIEFSTGSGASGNLVVFALSGEVVPEPGTAAFALMGLGALALRRRR